VSHGGFRKASRQPWNSITTSDQVAKLKSGETVRNIFVEELTNVKRFQDACGRLRTNTADVGCGLLFGGKGLGKTRTCIWAAAKDCESVWYVRALHEMNSRWLLRSLITEMGYAPQRGMERLFYQLEAILREMPSDALIIIDEIDILVRKPSVLGTLRDIFDMTQVPIVLAGLPEAELALKNYGTLMDRVTEVVRFQPLSLRDTRAAIDSICEVPCTPEAVQAVHMRIEPRMRALRKAVLRMEEMAAVNGWKRIEADHVPAILGGSKHSKATPKAAVHQLSTTSAGVK
jgi:hypothetical protein